MDFRSLYNRCFAIKSSQKKTYWASWSEPFEWPFQLQITCNEVQNGTQCTDWIVWQVWFLYNSHGFFPSFRVFCYIGLRTCVNNHLQSSKQFTAVPRFSKFTLYNQAETSSFFQWAFSFFLSSVWQVNSDAWNHILWVFHCSGLEINVFENSYDWGDCTQLACCFQGTLVRGATSNLKSIFA